MGEGEGGGRREEREAEGGKEMRGREGGGEGEGGRKGYPLSEVELPLRAGELEMEPLRRAACMRCIRFSLTLILFTSPSRSLPELVRLFVLL